MRLVALTLSGYKRFAEPAKLDTNGSLTAIVGPNEAGKTSLLQAMVRLDGEGEGELTAAELTRGLTFEPDHTVVDALYLVEPKDREEIAGLHGADDPSRARWFHYLLLRNGEVKTALEPRLERDLAPRRAAAKMLARARRRKEWPKELPPESPMHDREIDRLLRDLEGDARRLSPTAFQRLEAAASELREHDVDELEMLADTLDELRGHENQDHPNDTARWSIERVRPKFLLFDEQERELLTEYDLNVVAADPPPALGNLARLCGLNLPQLRDLIAADDSGTAKDVLEQSNRRLKDHFCRRDADRAQPRRRLRRPGRPRRRPGLVLRRRGREERARRQLLGIFLNDTQRARVEDNTILRSGPVGCGPTLGAGDGIYSHYDSGNVIDGNVVRESADDGIDVEGTDVVAENRVYNNGDLGIEAGPAVVDGGGNRARRNGNPLQCVNVGCS